MIVIDALVAALRSRGVPVIEQPQAAFNTGAHLDLWPAGFTAGGERGEGNPLTYETITFAADVVASGIARHFVGDLRNILVTMLRLGESSLPVPVTIPCRDHPGAAITHVLAAHFEKINPGAFEYEDETAPVPARFKESWRITITYRSDLIPEEE